MDNYRELYKLALDAFKEEKARFTRIDQKASLYFSALTFLVGVSGFFTKGVLNALFLPEGWLEWGIVLLGLACAGCVVAAWGALLSVLRVHGLWNIPLTDETIEFYSHEQLVDIYYHMARGLKEARERNIEITNRKAKRLAWSYRFMTSALVCAIAVASLFTIRYYV